METPAHILRADTVPVCSNIQTARGGRHTASGHVYPTIPSHFFDKACICFSSASKTDGTARRLRLFSVRLIKKKKNSLEEKGESERTVQESEAVSGASETNPESCGVHHSAAH